MYFLFFENTFWRCKSGSKIIYREWFWFITFSLFYYFKCWWNFTHFTLNLSMTQQIDDHWNTLTKILKRYQPYIILFLLKVLAWNGIYKSLFFFCILWIVVVYHINLILRLVGTWASIHANTQLSWWVTQTTVASWSDKMVKLKST